MRRGFLLLAAMLMLAACSGVATKTGASDHKRLEELAGRNGCKACHSLDQEMAGPAWREIAGRYAGKTSFEYAYDTYSLEDGLVKKVSLGGTHNWDGEFMKRNDPESLFQRGIRQKDIREMIRLILKLPVKEQPAAKSTNIR